MDGKIHIPRGRREAKGWRILQSDRLAAQSPSDGVSQKFMINTFSCILLFTTKHRQNLEVEMS